MDFKSLEHPTPRILRLREKFLSYEPQLVCQRGLIYTDVYQKNEFQHPLIQRSLGFLEASKRLDIFIEEDELLVGHHACRPRSADIYPETTFAWYDDMDSFPTRSANRLQVSDEVRRQIQEIYPYWKGKSIQEIYRSLSSEEAKAANKCGMLSITLDDSGLGHVVPEYSRILHMGVEGLLAQLEEYEGKLDANQPDYCEKKIYYTAGKNVLRGVQIFAERYRQLALEQAKNSRDERRRGELLRIAEILRKVPAKPAESFYEAMQSFTLTHMLAALEDNGYSISPGRFDQYMYPFYKKDLDEGILTEAEALELIDSFYLKTCEVIHVMTNTASEMISGYPVGENLTVGGVDRQGNDAVNDLSYLCLYANRHVRLNQPNFTARLHKNMPKLYLKMVVESIAAGNGMPQILNDEVIIKALIRKGFDLETARDYRPVGCDEITVKGHWGRCNGGFINFAKILEVTIGGGSDLLFQIPAGLKQDIDAAENFEVFKGLFLEQLRYMVRLQCADTNIIDYAHRQLLPMPLVSLFVDGCMQRGVDVTAGGAYHNSTTIVGCGTANCVDGLIAVKKLVYEQRKLTLPQFREMMRSNYEGDEYMRRTILNKLPKYGNDIDEVDALAVEVTEVFFDELSKYKTFHGGEFWAALYSVTAQVGLGYLTGAGADGRPAKMPLADGLTAMYGADKNGPTAALNSFTKMDLSSAPGGVIINQRFTRTLFDTESGRKKICDLFRSFIAKGGFHWQFNIVSTEEMRAAQEHPENYRDLVVRVAGYSAIFIELSKTTQESVIQRTEAVL